MYCNLHPSCFVAIHSAFSAHPSIVFESQMILHKLFTVSAYLIEYRCLAEGVNLKTSHISTDLFDLFQLPPHFEICNYGVMDLWNR